MSGMSEEQIAELLMRLREISESLAKIARPIRNVCPLCGSPVYPDESARIFAEPTKGIVQAPAIYGYSSYISSQPIVIPAHLWIHSFCLTKVQL